MAPRPADSSTPSDLFHLLVDSVRDYALFMLAPDGRILTWNTGAQRIKGYRSDEIVGRHFSVFYPSTDVRAGKPEYELRHAAETGRFEDEGWRIRKDGRRFWANVIITPVRDSHNTLVGFAKITRDLSERKQAEVEREILLEAERAARERAEAASARLDALQGITEVGISHVDLASLAQALAVQVEQVFAADHVGLILGDGDEARAIVERGPSDLPRPSPTDGIIRWVVENRGPLLYHGGLEAPQGDLERNLGGSWIVVPLATEETFIGVLYAGSTMPGRFRDDDLDLLQMLGTRVALALDHARAVEAEREARALMIAASETAQVRNEFIAVAAHELKTPLTSIRMAAQMATRRLGDADPTMLALVEQVVAQAGRLNRLVVALLDASRVDLGRLEMQPQETNITAIVRDIVQSTRRTSDREITLDESDEVVAEVDPLRFEQVVMNLMDNAVKYSPAMRPIVARLACEAGAFRLSVRDQGIGIPEGSREHVFDRFFQGHSESRQSGLGLGLYISREIVQAHGGTITAEFPADGGSLFTVCMPLTFPSPAPEDIEAIGSPRQPASSRPEG